MILLKAPDKYDINNCNKEKANKDCNICPYCGNTKDSEYLTTENGIKSWTYTVYNYNPDIKSIFGRISSYFSSTVYYASNYSCYKCGAEWRSDVYKL